MFLFLCRLLGFVPLFISTCDHNSTVMPLNCTSYGNVTFPQDIRIISVNVNADIDEILNPIMILVCFYVMALVSALLLGPQVSE